MNDERPTTNDIANDDGLRPAACKKKGLSRVRQALFYPLKFRFPNTVEIARFVYDAGVDSCEYGFRFFTGFEEFDFQFIIRCQGDPFDVVFFQHRVDDGADSDFQFIADAFLPSS